MILFADLGFPEIEEAYLPRRKPLDEIDTLERVESIYQSQPDKGGE